jgi:hypothetical protein
MSKLGELVTTSKKQKSGIESMRVQCRKFPPGAMTRLASEVQVPVSSLQDFMDGGKKLDNAALDRLTKRLWPGTQYMNYEDTIERAPSTATSMGIAPAPFQRRPDGVFTPPGPLPDMKTGALTKPYKAEWEDDE